MCCEVLCMNPPMMLRLLGSEGEAPGGMSTKVGRGSSEVTLLSCTRLVLLSVVRDALIRGAIESPFSSTPGLSMLVIASGLVVDFSVSAS